MGLGRAHFGLAALHGSLYAVGGVGWAKGGSQILDSCEKYDPGADVWVPIGQYFNVIYAILYPDFFFVLKR